MGMNPTVSLVTKVEVAAMDRDEVAVADHAAIVVGAVAAVGAAAAFGAAAAVGV